MEQKSILLVLNYLINLSAFAIVCHRSIGEKRLSDGFKKDENDVS